MAPAGDSLGSLQRWFQAVVTHSDGLAAGAAGAGPIEARILPSSRLAPEERLRVYANAYVARLVECLEAQYPALRRALGEEGFVAFARAYLEEHPSTHWSLDQLGAQLAGFLARTRPERSGDAPDWADLLAELADFEWTVLTVFDGPGVEQREVLDADRLGAIEPARFAACHLELAPSVVLKRYRFPLHEYYASLRDAPLTELRDAPPTEPSDAPEGDSVPLPAPAPQPIAFHRLRYRVYRYVLAPDEHALLTALGEGLTVGEALERALAASDASDEELPARVSGWFERFASAAFFVAVR